MLRYLSTPTIPNAIAATTALKSVFLSNCYPASVTVPETLRSADSCSKPLYTPFEDQLRHLQLPLSVRVFSRRGKNYFLGLYSFGTQRNFLHSSDAQSPSTTHLSPICPLGFSLMVHWNFLHSPDSHSPSRMHRSPICFPALAGKEIDKANTAANIDKVSLRSIVIPFSVLEAKKLN